MTSVPRLYFLLNRAQQALRKRVDRELRRRLGTSSAQVGALFFVEVNPGCLQRQLARALGQHESAATGMVSRMEEAGLLRRRQSSRDSRAWCLELSAGGRRLLERVRPLLADFNRDLSRGFEEEELEVVARFLERALRLAEEREP